MKLLLVPSTVLGIFALVQPAMAQSANAAPAAAAKAAPQAKAKGNNKKVGAFARALQKQDPAAYENFMRLRGERDKQLALMKSLRKDIRKASSEEKINLYQQFKNARKAYAKAYIDLIKFLDGRDQKRIERFEKVIKRIQAVMARRAKAIAQLEKALNPPAKTPAQPAPKTAAAPVKKDTATK